MQYLHARSTSRAHDRRAAGTITVTGLIAEHVLQRNKKLGSFISPPLESKLVEDFDGSDFVVICKKGPAGRVQALHITTDGGFRAAVDLVVRADLKWEEVAELVTGVNELRDSDKQVEDIALLEPAMGGSCCAVVPDLLLLEVVACIPWGDTAELVGRGGLGRWSCCCNARSGNTGRATTSDVQRPQPTTAT